jgi:hypothetical protein
MAMCESMKKSGFDFIPKWLRIWIFKQRLLKSWFDLEFRLRKRWDFSGLCSLIQKKQIKKSEPFQEERDPRSL